MKNNERIDSIINEFSGQNNTISFPKVYFNLTEDVKTAILLNEIVYWSNRTNRQDGYFAKSYNEWQEEIMLSKFQVKRAATKLEQLGLISTKRMGVLYYKAHMDEIEKRVNENNVRSDENER